MQLAVVCDYLEEGWPSMDLVAEMLAEHGRPLAEIALVRPAMPRLPTWLGTRSEQPLARPPLERALGRYLAYPAHLLPRRSRYERFHVADHSYAHLTLALPASRTGVYCHDLDAFRAAFPGNAAAPLRRALSSLLLRGLRRAAVVFYSTAPVREEILERALLPATRLVHAPYGVAREFCPRPTEHDAAFQREGRYVLHVGHLAPRKNPDFLLDLFFALAAAEPELRLVQIGGEWSAAQARRIGERGLGERVVQRRGLSRDELAAAYRSAALTLLPSKAEGFGLPIIEALACGGPVVVSDLAVLREVGGGAVWYAAPGALGQWQDVIAQARAAAPEARAARLAWANRFSWQEHATTIVNTYRDLS